MPEEFEAGVKFVAKDVGVTTTVDKMGTTFDRASDKMQKIVKQAGYLKYALVRIATYTAIFTFFATLSKLIGEAVSLQTRLAEVSTLVDLRNKKVAESFRVVTQDLLQLSPYLGKATDLTKGLYEIMSAGVTEPVEAFKLLVVASKYAKGGITDLATAASSLTAIMKAYGYTADEMRAKSDMLFASVMEGKYHAEELNQAIGKVLPTAAAMGVHIDEVSAALAVLTQRGLDVSEAATGLNRMMLSFLRPIDKTKKVFAKLGWEWGRNAFIGIGLIGVLRRILEASARYSDILPTIFRRQRALRVGFVLAGEGFKDYVRLLQKIRDATEGAGVVSRAYAKMIGTVAEEVKAAGAKMLKVMYELWHGKGFKWLGGFIRLASGFVAVVMKSSRVTLAAVPIIFGLAKAYKRAQITLAMWRANMAAFYATTGKMTKALYAQGVAFQVVTKRAERFAMTLRTLKASMIIGAIVYFATKTALDAYTSSLDKQIGAMHQEAKALKALKEKMNLYAAAANEAGIVTENVSAKMRELAIAEMLVSLRLEALVGGRRGNLLLFRKIMKALGEEFGEAAVKAQAMWVDVRRLIKVLREEGEVGEDLMYILRALAKNWGWTLEKTQEWLTEMRTSLPVVENWMEAMKFLMRLQRDWGKMVESSSRSIWGLARELSKQELEDGIKLLEELMTLTAEKDPSKWVVTVKYLKELGFSFEELTKEQIPEFLKKYKEALAIQPEEFRRMKFEEFMREQLVVFEKMHPPLMELEEHVKAVAEIWTTKWADMYEDNALGMKVLVGKIRPLLEILRANWSRLGEVEGKVLVEGFIKLMDKRLSIQEKAAKKAAALHEALIKDFIRIDAKMEVLRNALRGEEYNNIVEQTEKFVVLQQRKLDKWVELELEGGKRLLEIWEEYHKKRLILIELLDLALKVSSVRRIEAEAKRLKEAIDMTSWSEFEKQARYQQTYRQYFELMREMGITDKATLKAGLAVWKKTFSEIDRMTRSIFRRLTLAAGRFFASIILDLKNLEKNFGVFGKGLLTLFGTMVAEILITWLRGIITMEAALAAFVKKAKLMLKIFAVVFTAYVAAGIVKHLLTIFGVLKEQVDEATQEILDRLEEARRKGEEIKESISKEELSAGEYIGVGDGESITRWVDIYAEALEQLEKVLEHLAKQSEFTRAHIDLINDAWEEMIKAMEQYGVEGNAEIIELIRLTRELGIEVKVLDEYVLKWLDKGVKGLNNMVRAAGATEEELQRLANLALATFNAMIAQGRSWTEALAIMEEPLLILKIRMDALGVSGGEAIDALLDIVLVRRLYSDLFAAIEGNLAVLEALGNTASLFGDVGAQAFADVAAQAQEYYERLLAAGLTEEQALAVMAPTLQRLQYYAEQYGLELDANILKLIEQADALGLLEGAGLSMIEVLTEGFEGIIDAIRDLIEILTGTRGLTEAFDKVNHSMVNGFGGGNGGRAHVMRGGGFSPEPVSEGGRLVAVIEIDGRQFYKAIVPYVKEGVKYGDLEIASEEVY